MATKRNTLSRDELKALKIEFKEQLEEESDRGLALVGHAYLDDALTEFLRAFLVDDSGVADELLRQGGPLGSFKARCDLAFSLGLIGPDMYSDLGQVRSIRNAFAHRYTPPDFSSSPVLDRCRNLKIPDLDDPSKNMSARERFIMSVSLLAYHFLSQMEKTPHREIGRDYRVVISRFPASGLVAEKKSQEEM